MPLNKLGRVLFAAGLAGLGLLSVVFDDFAMNWQPVPQGVPFRHFLAYASGAILLGGGIGTLVRRVAALSALVLTVFVTSWEILLQLPRVASQPGDVGVWLGFCETMLLVTGGYVVFASLSRRPQPAASAPATGAPGLRLARILYGASLPVIGLSHLVYVGGTASMIPAWLPWHVGFAYLTGVGHMAAGAAILLGILPRLAATLEAAMISAFVLLLHLPGVAAAPASRLQWTMLCIACAYAGTAWTFAGLLSKGPWGLSRKAG